MQKQQEQVKKPIGENFNYDSFFNTLEKREENKRKVEFIKRIGKEFIDTSAYFVIGGELCYDENAV